MKYAVGFLFDAAYSAVALIRKNKPAWQKGLLNGIGGKIEETDQHPHAAMVREFHEETGGDVYSWLHYARMEGGGWTVECFAATGDFRNLRSNEEEQVEIIPIIDRTIVRADTIENLPWLINLAIDSMEDGHPRFTVAQYP